MTNNYINHVVFVLDESGSMQHLAGAVIKVFNAQIEYLAKRSKELNQETRISVYTFNYTVRCLIYDKDVLRMPSIEKQYSPAGGTALVDATIKAIEDLKCTPEIYGDHSFLVYVLSDGMENASKKGAISLTKIIDDLKDNWTLASLVPDQTAVHEAKKCGFPAQNIQVWATTQRGYEDVGETVIKATDAFMRARASGVRSTKSLFTLDASNLSSTEVKNTLQQLKPTDYHLLPVHKKQPIKPFVESWLQEPYRVNSAFYMINKPEKIQAYKQIFVQEKKTGKIYGGKDARTLLNLPDYETKVSPNTNGDYNIFVQSSSVNRNLEPGTQLLVLK